MIILMRVTKCLQTCVYVTYIGLYKSKYSECQRGTQAWNIVLELHCWWLSRLFL